MKPEEDLKEFRRALGQFPTGVTIITTADKNGELVGVTANSFNSVSMEPALVLWSVAKTARSAEIFEQTEYFSVNILGKNQTELSNKFAKSGSDKFDNTAYTSGLGDAPLLDGCAANFQCKTWRCYDGGDHTIIIGEVMAYMQNPSVMPLVFTRGNLG